MLLQANLSAAEQILQDVGFYSTLRFAQERKIPFVSIHNLVYLVLEHKIKKKLDEETLVNRMRWTLFGNQYMKGATIAGLGAAIIGCAAKKSLNILSVLGFFMVGFCFGHLYFALRKLEDQKKLETALSDDVKDLEQKQMEERLLKLNQFLTNVENNV